MEEDSGSELDDSVSLDLLMVHSETLRFELLQLELESGEVTVKDILRHSAQNVTDSTLKKLCLEKFADREGNFYSGNTSLATILGGKQNNIVLVAVAKGITLEASHRLSTPILSDSKVVRMVSLFVATSVFFSGPRYMNY